uniref:Uncharacterized protein n=1 Tax=Anguilla anguilla TaxID=7936 RepID=A0A0E9U1Q6_ANGAN
MCMNGSNSGVTRQASSGLFHLISVIYSICSISLDLAK